MPRAFMPSSTAMRRMRMFIAPVVMASLGFAAGWSLQPPPPDPVVQIKSITVMPTLFDANTKTRLHITTRFSNSGCTQTLLTRFLLNSHPAPSVALPQHHGPTVLPIGEEEIIEDVLLDFPLTHGTWHLFSVASCYLNGDPVPAATVAPTALFDIAEADR